MKIEINKIDNFENIGITDQIDVEGNFFLNPRWLSIVSEIFDLENVHLEIKYQGSVLYFLAQKQGNILFAPFIGYGGIINFLNLKDKEIAEIFSNIESFTGCKIKRAKFFPNIPINGKNISKNIHSTVILEISENKLDQEKRYTKVIRNSIKYAERKGVKIRTITNDQIDDFYSIYVNTMKRVKSDYITPKNLFEKICTIKDVIFLGAYLNEKMIAGSVFMISNNFIFYWWNASNESGRNLCANYLLIDNAIKMANTRGLKYLDMASSNNKNIERGKLLWGGEKVPFLYFDFS